MPRPERLYMIMWKGKAYDDYLFYSDFKCDYRIT